MKFVFEVELSDEIHTPHALRNYLMSFVRNFNVELPGGDLRRHDEDGTPLIIEGRIDDVIVSRGEIVNEPFDNVHRNFEIKEFRQDVFEGDDNGR